MLKLNELKKYGTEDKLDIYFETSELPAKILLRPLSPKTDLSNIVLINIANQKKPLVLKPGLLILTSQNQGFTIKDIFQVTRKEIEENSLFEDDFDFEIVYTD